jgi:signal transduction histidine kinase
MTPRLQRVHSLLNQVEADLHRFSHELRPTILDDLGLVPAGAIRPLWRSHCTERCRTRSPVWRSPDAHDALKWK